MTACGAPVCGGVDVLVPCYNYGRFLEACVDSVLSGARRPVRVLILDDCSTDDTWEIAAALADKHSSVFSARHTTNIGHIATYNEGIGWAESAYLVLLSADDLLAPGALDRAAAVFDRHPQVGLVYGNTRTFFDDVPPRPDVRDACDATVIDGLDFISAIFADGRNPIASPASVMVRTSLQHDVGGYRPELPHAGDLEMYLRFAARSAVGYLDVDQGLYRKHASNMSRGFQDLRDYAQRRAAFEAVCSDERARLPGRAVLLQRVRRAMATELFWAASRAFEEGALGDAAIDEQLAFAGDLDPSMRRTRSWQALRVKRVLGRRWTRRTSRMIDAIGTALSRPPAC